MTDDLNEANVRIAVVLEPGGKPLIAEDETVSTDDEQRLTRVIFDYARRLTQEQSKQSLLAVIADFGRALVSADRCSIWLLNEETGMLTTQTAHGTAEISLPRTHGLVGKCVTSGTVVISNDLRSERETAALVDRTTGYLTKSILAVPLCDSHGKCIGAFQALNKPGGFAVEDAELLGLAAAYSASTLEAKAFREQAMEAQRLKREMEIAREVQQQLVPTERSSNAGGLHISACCYPAEQVGGDYYDWIVLDDESVILVLGDISGKGIAAALLMASVQASIRSIVSVRHIQPSQLMTDLNKIVYNSSTITRYSTLFLGHYNPRTSRLTTVNAGQVSPFLFRKDGPTEYIEPDGPPVGLLANVEFTQQERVLLPGDTLVCCSDGLSECHNRDGEMWSDLGYEDALGHLSTFPSDKIPALLVEKAQQFATGAKQHDDMTVLCFRHASQAIGSPRVQPSATEVTAA